MQRRGPSEWFRHAAYVVPMLLALWVFDRWLSEDRTIGSDRRAVRAAQGRWLANADATVIMLGASTSGDWIRPAQLAGMMGIEPSRVLDAHMPTCHIDCTYAEVRQLLRMERRYATAFLGLNLYQMCEREHPTRVMQHEMLMPAKDLLDLARLYAHGERPLNYAGRYLGVSVSGAYADSGAVEKKWSPVFFGDGLNDPKKSAVDEETDSRAWYTDAPAVPRDKLARLACPYEPEDVAYKRAALSAVLADLGRLAGRTYLMVLPDRSLESDDPEIARAWQRHYALLTELVRREKHVRLIDLTHNDALRPRHFRDGLHLSRAGAKVQRELFFKKLLALHAVPKWKPPPKREPEKEEDESDEPGDTSP